MPTQLHVTYSHSKRVIANNEHDSWGVFIVRNPEGRQLTAVGVMRDDVRQKGVQMMLEGQWKSDRYTGGHQFVFTNHVVKHPAGRDGVIAMLKTAPRIGQQTAEKLWNLFGEKAPQAVVAQLEDAAELLGTNMTKAAVAIEGILGEANYYYPLINLFKGVNLPHNLAHQVIKRRWGDPVTLLRKNPFLLLNFPGVGFLKADALRVKLKLDPLMPERLNAAVAHALEQYRSQTWVVRQQIMSDVGQLLSMRFTDARQVVRNAIVTKYVAAYTEAGTEYIAVRKYAEQELEAADRLAALTRAGVELWPPVEVQPGGISQHQKDQLDHATQNGSVAVLLGSAGTGKTHTASQQIKACLRDEMRVVVCAPTGKAALRIEQTLIKQGVHGVKPTTIHRALGAIMDSEGFRFLRDGDPLYIEADFILIDEGSMVGNDLACSLFRAIKPGTLVMIIGDPHQLASVSRGTILRDWPAWCKQNPEYTCGHLTEIRRNEGEIISACEKIYHGTPQKLKTYDFPGKSWTKSTNLQLGTCLKDVEIHHRLDAFYAQALRGEIKLPDGKPADPLIDIQVIVSTNSNSPASRDEVNKFLQAKLNPEMKGLHSHFKVMDKIICVSNSWLPNPDGRDLPKIFVANGSIGYVLKSEKKRITARMDDYPGMNILIPTGAGKGDFDLAYAITCHKMQGSQAPIVVTLLSDSYGAKQVMDRGWIYTAITRAQYLAVVLGSNQSFRAACARNYMEQRKSFVLTWLKRRLP
jgi:exodeoxyribonuclease V alpha subunit